MTKRRKRGPSPLELTQAETDRVVATLDQLMPIFKDFYQAPEHGPKHLSNLLGAAVASVLYAANVRTLAHVDFTVGLVAQLAAELLTSKIKNDQLMAGKPAGSA